MWYLYEFTEETRYTSWGAPATVTYWPITCKISQVYTSRGAAPLPSTHLSRSNGLSRAKFHRHDASHSYPKCDVTPVIRDITAPMI